MERKGKDEENETFVCSCAMRELLCRCGGGYTEIGGGKAEGATPSIMK